jgi:FkbM family methyltransferase
MLGKHARDSYRHLGKKHPWMRRLLQPVVHRAGHLLATLAGQKYPAYFPFWSIFQLVFRKNESDTVTLVRRLIRPGMCVLDIGANVGYFTRLFAQLAGRQGHVFAFEPGPQTMPFLESNTRSFRNVKRMPWAVSDRDDTVTFYLHPTSSASNSLYDLAGAKERVTVPSVSIDTFARQHHISRVDLVKIDVEGAEPLVVQGMAKQIQAQDQILIIIEYCPKNLTLAGHAPSAFIESLRAMDLHPHSIDAGGGLTSLESSMPTLPQGDDAFVNLLCAKKPVTDILS